MAQTMMTVKQSETGDQLERLGRRWAGVVLEVRVVPQSDGRATLTVTTPTGVDEPPDPGPHPLFGALSDALVTVASLSDKVDALAAARDASDAEAQQVREDRDATVTALQAELAEARQAAARAVSEHEQ